MYRFVCVLSGVLGLVSCTQLSVPSTDDDAASIDDALELANGGFEESDEAPAFGDDNLSSEETANEETADPVLEDAQVLAMMESQGAKFFDVAIRWGQIPGNLENPEAIDWSGSLSVSRGAILVRRVIAFDRNDKLLVRENRDEVSFISHTRPHFDGLLVTVIDPTPSEDAALTLTYRHRDPSCGDAIVLSIAGILEQRAMIEIDEFGNAIVVAATDGAADTCNQGHLEGRWEPVDNSHGRFIARVTNGAGETVGHVRGVYGVRVHGAPVLFGKYIDVGGQFRGVISGTYSEHQFEGRWHARGAEAGTLGGVHFASPDAESGILLGAWRELTCDATR